jgi:hypothetical protein
MVSHRVSWGIWNRTEVGAQFIAPILQTDAVGISGTSGMMNHAPTSFLKLSVIGWIKRILAADEQNRGRGAIHCASLTQTDALGISGTSGVMNHAPTSFLKLSKHHHSHWRLPAIDVRPAAQVSFDFSGSHAVQFDPAIAAQLSFTRAQASGELGADLAQAKAAEEIFSGSAGSEARAAYFELQAIGGRHPDAVSFQEFLIYITWQQVTEETLAAHFQRGADLCDRYLDRAGDGRDPVQVEQIRELRRSFRAGLGQTDEEVSEYEEDRLIGGD